MRQKAPRRGIGDAIDGLDVILAQSRAAVLASLDEPADGGDTKASVAASASIDAGSSPVTAAPPERTASRGPAKARRADPAASLTRSESGSSSSAGSGAAVFAGELALLYRRAEESADHAQFLAAAVPRAASGRALLALVQHLRAGAGAAAVLEMRRLGHMRPFLAALLAPPPDAAAAPPSPSYRCSLARFYAFLCAAAPQEALACAAMLRALIAMLGAPLPPAVTSLPPPPPPTVSVVAAAKSRSLLPSVAALARPANLAGLRFDTSSDSALAEAVFALCGDGGEEGDNDASAEEAPVLHEQVALAALTQLLLARNQAAQGVSAILARSASDGVAPPAPVLFYRAGGFSACTALIRAQHGAAAVLPWLPDMLTLLEVATCSDDLRGEDGASAALADLFLALVRALGDGGESAGGVCFAACARVLINVTSLFPAAVGEEEAAVLGVHLARAVRDDMRAAAGSGGGDAATIALCLGVNLLRAAPAAAAACRAALLAAGSFVEDAAAEMLRLHGAENDAGANVGAGYYATLLAATSLGDETARVRVITGITRAIEAAAAPGSGKRRDSRANGRDVALELRRPMVLAVAIMQEFLLFQSSAGILTKDALLAMHGIIERVVTANRITVETQDESESCAATSSA